MRIGFIGCPSSWKTTTATSIFVALKEMAVPCEYVPEYARLYIAEVQARCGRVKLFDEDQQKIIRVQAKWESVVWRSTSEQRSGVVCVSDSSPWNSLLYLSDPEVAERESGVLAAREAVLPYDLAFWAQPPEAGKSVLDPNRIHDDAESRVIHERVAGVVAPHVRLVPLRGALTFRVATALTMIDAKLREVP